MNKKNGLLRGLILVCSFLIGICLYLITTLI